MENLAPRYMREEEYLELERKAPHKSEYYKGEIFGMAGAKRSHNLIVTNLCREISFSLKDKPCEVYPSDMRVKNREATEGEVFQFQSLDVILKIEDIYAKVEFPPKRLREEYE